MDSRHRQLPAFTLVEVIISIAIALVLIIGISRIFSIAQQTTGAGNELNAASEMARGSLAVLTSDLRNMANGTDSPGLIIVSYSAPAWRNMQDKVQDADGDPMTLNPVAGNPPQKLSLEMVNSRIHRLDRICFFARDRYARQTADAPSFDSPTTSNEAFIWMGHLALPNNAAINTWSPNAPGGCNYPGFFNPGAPDASTTSRNDNNMFASDWILGREVMLLIPTLATLENAFVPATSAGGDVLSLFGAQSTSNGSPQVELSSSRYDLAVGSIDTYWNITSNVNSPMPWWARVGGFYMNPPQAGVDFRYVAQPFARKPLKGDSAVVAGQKMSASIAQTHPIFVRGCTQFIVEFAGDFVTQDNDPSSHTYGQVTAAKSDGQIDFTLDPVTGVRKIQWYGFPRNTSGNATIKRMSNGQYADVVPVQTVAGTQQPFVFERVPMQWNPGRFPAVTPGPHPAGDASKTSYPYVCVWDPSTDAANIPRPKMIRITMAVDDPAAHLSQEQTYEYVFELP